MYRKKKNVIAASRWCGACFLELWFVVLIGVGEARTSRIVAVSMVGMVVIAKVALMLLVHVSARLTSRGVSSALMSK